MAWELTEEDLHFAKDSISRIKEAMRLSIKRTSVSREEVVDYMNALAEVAGVPPISKDSLDQWTSNDPKRVIPFLYVEFFCRATQSRMLGEVPLRQFGGKWITDAEAEMLELGIAEIHRINSEEKKRLILENVRLRETEKGIKRLLNQGS